MQSHKKKTLYFILFQALALIVIALLLFSATGSALAYSTQDTNNDIWPFGDDPDSGEIDICIFDNRGRDMRDHDDVDKYMQIELLKPGVFGPETVAESNGAHLNTKITEGRFKINVYWMDEVIYEEARTLSTNTTYTIHLDRTPGKIIDQWARESLQASSDLRDLSTPFYSVQLGVGDNQEDILINTQQEDITLKPRLEIDGNTKDFVFEASSPDETDTWTKDSFFGLFEDSYHFSSSSSKKVGDNMLVTQWVYGYFDSGDVLKERIIQGATAGAVAGALGGTVASPGIGTAIGGIAGAGAGAIGAAVASSVRPELLRSEAPGGVGALTIVTTPRYMKINTVTVNESETDSRVSMYLDKDMSYLQPEDSWYEEDIYYAVDPVGSDPVTDLYFGAGRDNSPDTISCEWRNEEFGQSNTPDSRGGDFYLASGGESIYMSDSDWSSEYGVSISETGYMFKKNPYDGYGILPDNDNKLLPGIEYKFEISIGAIVQREYLSTQTQDTLPLKANIVDSGGNKIGGITANPDVTLEDETSSVPKGEYYKFSTYQTEKIGVTEEEKGIGFDISMPEDAIKGGWLYDLSIDLIPVEDSNIELFEDEVNPPMTRLMDSRIPAYQPGVGSPVEVETPHRLIAIDVRGLEDVSLLNTWDSRDVTHYASRIALTSSEGNWSESVFLLGTDNPSGFKGVGFTISQSEKLKHKTDIGTYHMWTGPSDWSQKEDWSPVYFNGSQIRYPSPGQWGTEFGTGEKWQWSLQRWWKENGPMVKLALFGALILIAVIILLLVAPWVLVGIFNIFRKIGKNTKKSIEKAREGKSGKKGEW